MLRLLCLICLVVALLCPAPVPAQSPGPAGGPSVQEGTTAEQVVAAYLEAIGGTDAIKGVQSRRMSYWVHTFGRDAFLMEQYWIRPDTLRTGPPGATAYTLTEGETSWRVGPEGRRELPATATRSLSKRADIDGPLVDPAEKGVTLTYSGVVRFDMAELHHVTLTFKDGTQQEFFFDSRTGLLRKMIQPSFLMVNDEITRGPDTQTYYYDYRPVGSLLFPHFWIQTNEDHTHLFVVEEIELEE